MQRYYILLKATGAGGWPGWLPYRLDADSAEPVSYTHLTLPTKA